MRVEAPAKINLDLRVFGQRSDGFHEIETLMQTIDIADELHASVAPPDVLELRVHPTGVLSSGEDNLVLRAARALRQRAGSKVGARLKLHKKIPVGAGLGGGSSDAAATLLLLDELWELRLGRAVLFDLATELGSDVPFFLVGGLAVATGRGEILRPLPDLRPHGVVVCVPPLEVSTADVYERFSKGRWLTSRGPKDSVDLFTVDGEETEFFEPPWRDLANDLEQVVLESWPQIGRALSMLRATNALHAAVTGSGAAVFAIFPDAEAAKREAEGLNGELDAYVTSTIGRSPGRPKME